MASTIPDKLYFSDSQDDTLMTVDTSNDYQHVQICVTSDERQVEMWLTHAQAKRLRGWLNKRLKEHVD